MGAGGYAVSLVVLLLYPLAIQYSRGGYWRVLMPLTLLVAILDVICNYTELALLTWDWPRSGEVTFSQRCKRMKLENTWGGTLARFIEPFLDYFDPDGDHI